MQLLIFSIKALFPVSQSLPVYVCFCLLFVSYVRLFIRAMLPGRAGIKYTENSAVTWARRTYEAAERAH
jgi:hypothetical protein